MPLQKPLESIEEADLIQLIIDKAFERRTIEYKEILHGNSEGQIKEFLADVASFANADGGDLVYGMKEDSGIPTELPGLDGIDPDAEILRLECSIRDGIDPRIPRVQARAVNLSNSKTAIIVRVPRGWAAPHMVKFRGSSRFFSRSSNGKYQLDIREIRTAFLIRESTADRIRDFRADRIGRVVGGQAPLELLDGAKVVLHIVPVTAFDPAFALDIKQVKQIDVFNRLAPIFSAHASSSRYNFDGVVSFDLEEKSRAAFHYLQLFRSGVIETINALFLYPSKGERIIANLSFEQGILIGLQKYFALLADLRIQPPVFVMLSLLGVKGYRMGVDVLRFPDIVERIIDREVLILPEILVEDFTCDIGREMRPAFDTVWQAAGWEGSRNYDDTGKWIERK